MSINPIIRQIVDRCHVGESNRSVIYYVISRLKNKRKTYWSMAKNDRKEFLRQIIECHNKNKDLYHKVVTGKFLIIRNQSINTIDNGP